MPVGLSRVCERPATGRHTTAADEARARSLVELRLLFAERADRERWSVGGWSWSEAQGISLSLSCYAGAGRIDRLGHETA